MDIYLNDEKIAECKSIETPESQEIIDYISTHILFNTFSSKGVCAAHGWDKYQRWLAIESSKTEFYRNNKLWTKIVKKLRKKNEKNI